MRYLVETVVTEDRQVAERLVNRSMARRDRRRGCSTLSPTASIAFVTMAFLRTAIVRRSSRFAGIFWRHRPRRRLHLPLTIGSGIAN